MLIEMKRNQSQETTIVQLQNELEQTHRRLLQMQSDLGTCLSSKEMTDALLFKWQDDGKQYIEKVGTTGAYPLTAPSSRANPSC